MLYSCLIEEDEPLRPFVQMYWAYADELGEALESMVAAAALNGLGRPRCKRADPSDPAHLKRDLVVCPLCRRSYTVVADEILLSSDGRLHAAVRGHRLQR
jgi:hypothetical protein